MPIRKFPIYKRALLAAVALATIAVSTPLSSISADDMPGRGYGREGYGAMGPSMMGQGSGQDYTMPCAGMPGAGYGYGYGAGMMMGQGNSIMGSAKMGQTVMGRRDLKLNEVQARTLIDARLVLLGNDLIETGSVAPDGEDAFVVDIVTSKEKALVEKLTIDRRSGWIAPVR